MANTGMSHSKWMIGSSFDSPNYYNAPPKPQTSTMILWPVSHFGLYRLGYIPARFIYQCRYPWCLSCLQTEMLSRVAYCTIDSLAIHFINDQPLVKLLYILKSRIILKRRQPIKQVLVQWDNQLESNATWETLTNFHRDYLDFHLKGKVLVRTVIIDAISISRGYAASSSQDDAPVRRSGWACKTSKLTMK